MNTAPAEESSSVSSESVPAADSIQNSTGANQLRASIKAMKDFKRKPSKPLSEEQKAAKRERERQRRERKKLGLPTPTRNQIKRESAKKWKAKFKTEERMRVKYTPQGHQRKFREFLDAGKRIVLMLGGIRSGKTYAGAREALRRIYMHPYTRGIGWIVSPTFPMSLVVEREFENACQITETESLILKKNINERSYLLYPPKGHLKPYRVEIKSAEHPDRLRGASLDWIWMDEAAMMSEETWKILLGRVLDSKGVIFLTTTPKGRNWIYTEIFQRSVNDDRIGIVKALTVDNEYLDKKDIEYLQSGYSMQFAQQELAAEFVNFEGLVYHSFNFDKNVVPPITAFPEGAEMISGLDFGLHDPTVHLWVMKHNGRFYVVDEYYAKDRTLEDHARSIKSNYWDRYVIRRWADPSGGQERLDFDKYGIGTYEAKNDIRPGINAVQRLFEDNKLFIARNCLETLKEISVYQYKSKEGRNSLDEPVDYANHTMDALRYAIYSEAGYGNSLPYLTMDERGDIRVHDTNEDYLSNKLEDWVRLRAHPLHVVHDEETDYMEPV